MVPKPCADPDDHRDPDLFGSGGPMIRYRVPNEGTGKQYTFDVVSAKPATITHHRPLSDNPMSMSCLQMAKGWLEKCSSHDLCRRLSGLGAPTRFIDVREGGLRLCEVDRQDVAYATLSHRWGPTPFTLTTRASLDDYMKALSFENLPQTFQDAITVTRKLEIPYSWIDSLCIIQGSEGDWVSEVPETGGYYENALLNISALKASGAHEGFHHPRPTAPSVQVPGDDPALRMVPSIPDRREVFRNAVLNSRGWTFQERLLSTSVLHFSQQGLFWECQTCSTHESTTLEHGKAQRHGQGSGLSLISAEHEDFKRYLASLSAISEPKTTYNLWRTLVRYYSRRQLTYGSDRLPAISALAKLIASNTNSVYLAGIWQADISGLAWFRESKTYRISHDGELDRTDGVSRAPSWSWASLEESVTDRFDEDYELVVPYQDPTITSVDIE